MELGEGGLSPEKQTMAESILLDTSIRVHQDPKGRRFNTYNFEIQLPSKSEYCIDWIQNYYPKKPLDNFSPRRWRLDEVLRWVDPGGSETIVSDEPTGQQVDRSEIESKLSKIGLTLEEISSCYYQRALQAGHKGFVARPWHS